MKAATKVYIVANKEAQSLLREILNHVEAIGQFPDMADWGDVGSMELAVANLKSMANYLGVKEVG